MKISGKIIKRIIACILLLMLIPASALAEFQAVVTAKRMQVYSTNSAEAKYNLGSLTKGTEVTVVATSGEWSRITYQGRTGYAKNADMEKVTVSPVSKTLAYTNRMVNVYTSASSTSRVIDVLTCDYPVYIVGATGKYYKVTNTNGEGSGYIYKSYLSVKRTNPLSVASKYKKTYSSNNSSTTMPAKLASSQYAVSRSMGKDKYIEYVIYAAQSRLGCAYKASGANNVNTFKNAGFVSNCFAQLKYSVPTDVRSIGHKGTAEYVSRKNLKRGDVVCFNCDTSDGDVVDHVGIYLGNGYFIHASSAAGMVVVSKMSSGYYYNAFCWGRRYIK